MSLGDLCICPQGRLSEGPERFFLGRAKRRMHLPIIRKSQKKESEAAEEKAINSYNQTDFVKDRASEFRGSLLRRRVLQCCPTRAGSTCCAVGYHRHRAIRRTGSNVQQGIGHARTVVFPAVSVEPGFRKGLGDVALYLEEYLVPVQEPQEQPTGCKDAKRQNQRCDWSSVFGRA